MNDSTPRRADARRNREKILDIAERVFAQEGIDIPMADVARRVGVGVGTLYRHFPTKEALFSAILTDRMEALVAVGRKLAEANDPGRAFFDFFDHVIEQALVNAALYTALSEASGVGLDAASSLGAALLKVERELLERAQRAGAVRDDIDAGDLKSIVSGCLTMVRHGRHPERLQAVVRDGLRPPGDGATFNE